MAPTLIFRLFGSMKFLAWFVSIYEGSESFQPNKLGEWFHFVGVMSRIDGLSQLPRRQCNQYIKIWPAQKQSMC